MKWTPITAIVCLTTVICFAACRNIDGALLATGCAVIGGIGGYGMMYIKERNRRNEK